jgi:Ser/Thr protein kinase RdoA (MazF antagonist)
LLALRSAPPVFGVAEAERIARDLYGLAVSIQPLPGERDCNFHLRTADRHEYVLKIVDGAAAPRATDCQIRVLRHLAEQDPSLPVPRMVPTLDGVDTGTVERTDGTYSICLMSYLRGRLLVEVAPDASLITNVGTTLARLDRALQGFFIRRWRSSWPGTYAACPSSWKLRLPSNRPGCGMPSRRWWLRSNCACLP